MDLPLPSFRKPPVIETALSIQFQPLKEFKNAHLGLFWSRHQVAFPSLSDADPIVAQREVFGDDRAKMPGPPRVRFGTDPAARLQMTSPDLSRMVQVQNGRLVFNWRRVGDNDYPRWNSVKPELLEYWKDFVAFITERGMDPPNFTQWEVVYVNHLLKGRDWGSPLDWADLVPGLLGPSGRFVNGGLESLSANWHIGLTGNRGRLHIDLSHAFTVANSEPVSEPMELLLLQLTARGPVGEGDSAIEEGLELGHTAIVQNFTAITGDEAHRKWERQS